MKTALFVVAKLCLHVMAALVLVGIVLPLLALGVGIFVSAAIVKNHVDGKTSGDGA